jgi:hypothetical protein
MTSCDRSAHEWFAEAAKCYIEKHQGCPWCSGSHRVFHTDRGPKREYACSACDFRAGYDAASNRYFSHPGEEHARDNPEAANGNDIE